MDIITAVTFIKSIKDTYGDNLKATMLEQARNNMSAGILVAMETASFGLVTDDPTYLTDFAEAGGDVDYLNQVRDIFLEVRGEVYGI